MAFVVPATWKLHSQNGNSVTYTRVGHTTKEPRLCLIDRTPANFDSRTGKWSTPSYRVRVADGVLDANGNPVPTRTLCEYILKHSVAFGEGRTDDVHADMMQVVNQPDFVSAATGPQDFPGIAAS